MLPGITFLPEWFCNPQSVWYCISRGCLWWPHFLEDVNHQHVFFFLFFFFLSKWTCQPVNTASGKLSQSAMSVGDKKANASSEWNGPLNNCLTLWQIKRLYSSHVRWLPHMMIWWCDVDLYLLILVFLLFTGRMMWCWSAPMMRLFSCTASSGPSWLSWLESSLWSWPSVPRAWLSGQRQ